MLSLLLAVGAALAQRTVTLDEALALAARSSPQVELADARVREARARANGVRSNLGFTVTLEGSTLWWNEKSEAVFVEGNPCEDLDDYMVDWCNQLIGDFTAPILLRDSHTTSFAARATQPLTPLYRIFEGWRATQALLDAAGAQADQARSLVAVDVVDTYFQALKVEKLVAVAEEGIRTLQAHEARGQAFYDAGLIGRNEVLQIQVALSGLQVDLQRAKAGQALLAHRLAQVAGVDEPLVAAPLEVDPDRLPPLQVTDQELQDRVGQVPQARAVQAQVQAAESCRRAALGDLVPQVAAIGTFERYWGLGEMSEDQQWYLGLGAQWDVWGWGKKAYAVQECQAQGDQARAGLRALQDGVLLQARSALSDARLAREALAAARTRRAQADENLRIVTARFEAHTTPATDLLEAQTLATRARADEVGAAYDALIAVGRLQQVLGLPVRPLEGVGG